MNRNVLLPAPCSLVMVLSLPNLVGAQTDTAKSAEPTPWTIDDILRAEQAGQFQISPDGKWVVWVRTTVDPEKGRVSNLYVSSLTERREIQLTRGSATHSSPRWSPDGKVISFLSTRPLPEPKEGTARSQLWLMNPFGGEPWALTAFERGIRDYEWRDSATVVFLAQEDAGHYERAHKKDDSRVVDDSLHEPPVRLFSLEVASKQVRRLSSNDDWMSDLAVSPDGRWGLTLHDRELSYAFDQRQHPATWLWNLQTGVATQLFADHMLIPSQVWWARDGSGFYVTSDTTRDPRWRTATVAQLSFYDVATQRAAAVPLGWPRGIGTGLTPTPDGAIVSLADGVHLRLARLTRTGGGSWTKTLLTGTHVPNILGFTVSRDGQTIVYQYSTASTPPQWYRGRLDGGGIADPTLLTDLNASFKKKTMPRTEIVRWRGARNEEVEGMLYYPIGYEVGKRYPLILSIHGGPAGADLDAWSQSWAYPNVLLNQKGTFLLKANYHGSSNYGLDWVESIGHGNYYDLEVPDFERGIEYMVGRGLVDVSRLATMGWSNGAIISIELTTRDRRLKAASTGAGDVEWISDWANVDFGMSFDNYYFGKAPYEDPQLYIRKSPYFRLNQVRTPTIIYFGTEDRNVPPSQGWSHYRALQQLGNTEVKFVLFPGEPHGLQQLAHQRRKVEEDLAWFDRHLFTPVRADSAARAALAAEAFDSTSPLGLALRRQRIARVGTRDGVALHGGGTVIPEIVRYQGFDLGRFEVTRAQWAAFDSSYRVEPGTENYPANNVTFQSAQAYLQWLSRVTGESYRLGTEQELKPLYEGAAASENTLDYWAGYTLNPSDTRWVAERTRLLPGEAPLLKEVGSFAGRGDAELVFDLGGNAAEWAVGANGQGILLGGSADRPADAKAGPQEAATGYRGLRVVRGAAPRAP